MLLSVSWCLFDLMGFPNRVVAIRSLIIISRLRPYNVPLLGGEGHPYKKDRDAHRTF